MTDYKQLIHRMADELDYYRQLLTDDRREVHALAMEARAALAADGPAVPEGREPAAVTGEPSDAELLELWKGWNLGWDPQRGTVLMPHPAEFARAVLARWGRPAPVPVAVSEQLPRPEDCDAEGRCWWYRYTPTPEWHLRLGRTGQHNHWLSAHALPVPTTELQP